MQGMTEKAVFTSLEALCSSCKSVRVRGRIDKAVFMTVEWLSNAYKAV